MIKKLICLLIVCVLSLIATGCDLLWYAAWFALPHPAYSEYSTYENFAWYQSDFETVKVIIEENGEGGYSLDERDGSLGKRYNAEDGDVYYIDLELSADEQQSVKDIVENSYLNSFHSASYKNDDDLKYVFFFEEQGCGVVYTDDIDAFIKYHTKVDYFYNWLGENWYAVYH